LIWSKSSDSFFFNQKFSQYETLWGEHTCTILLHFYQRFYPALLRKKLENYKKLKSIHLHATDRRASYSRGEQLPCDRWWTSKVHQFIASSEVASINWRRDRRIPRGNNRVNYEGMWGPIFLVTYLPIGRSLSSTE